MGYTLTQSLVDPLRLYVLGIPANSGPTATPGLYTSADAGKTWQPTTAASRQAVGIACDPLNADTVSITHSYPLGVDVSSDGGKSWQDGLS